MQRCNVNAVYILVLKGCGGKRGWIRDAFLRGEEWGLDLKSRVIERRNKRFQ